MGVGRLGRAIINYPGFSPEGFEIVAAFDRDSTRHGTMLGNISVESMENLPETIKERDITIGIVAVPAIQAQMVVDALITHGVQGILNYAPVAPLVPAHIIMRNIDPVLSLQSMTFYMKENL